MRSHILLWAPKSSGRGDFGPSTRRSENQIYFQGEPPAPSPARAGPRETRGVPKMRMRVNRQHPPCPQQHRPAGTTGVSPAANGDGGGRPSTPARSATAQSLSCGGSDKGLVKPGGDLILGVSERECAPGDSRNPADSFNFQSCARSMPWSPGLVCQLRGTLGFLGFFRDWVKE